ncbi:MAG: hypothetical protein AAF616_09385 [Bacteroidota bacterium]
MSNQFLKNAWVVTLTSTILGIVIGIFLTDFFQQRRLIKDQKNALELVIQEIEDNQVKLREYHDTLALKFDAFQYLYPYLFENEKQLVVHKDSLQHFKRKSFPIVKISGTDSITTDSVRITGEVNLSFNSNSTILLTGLTTVVWDTYKSTNYLSVTRFGCLTRLEELYTLQKDFNRDNATLVDQLLSKRFLQSEEISLEFLNQWEKLLLKQRTLLNFFENSADNYVVELCG